MWAAGAEYERFIGRWSRPVAVEFVRWLGVRPSVRWLDVGCGTGALTQAILATTAPRSVIGVDPSAAFLDLAREATPDPRAEFHLGDARRLDLADAAVDAVASGLVLNFVPDKAGAVRELRRVVAPGGTVGVYLWDYPAGGMQLLCRFWEAAVAVDPGAAAVDERTLFPVCAPEPLTALFTDAGFREVEHVDITVPTVFSDFDDYWQPFLGGQGPAPSYLWTIDDDTRQRIRDEVRGLLPVAADGSIALTARAWAVRGIAP
jgi:ubiquinone/menaquinone biosynthesis C-methylase UbiE